MRAIKHALTERYYTWEEAVGVAASDPEIDMHAEDGQVYKPSAYEEDVVEESWAEGKSAEQESVKVKAEKEPSR